MSTAQAAPKLAAPEAILNGRIANVRRIQTKSGPQFVHVVKLPAPDQFTSPQTVELRGLKRMGGVGDDLVGVRVRIGGYGRSYKVTDADTGEVSVIPTADNSLTIVDGE